MKKYLIVLLLICNTYQLFAQEKKEFKISLAIGRSFLNTMTNNTNLLYAKYEGSDLSRLYELSPNEERAFSLELTLPSKHENINYVAGSLFMQGVETWMSDNFGSGTVDDEFVYTYYVNSEINGGGVYGGLETKAGNKHIGITAKFTVGVFSFKNSTTILDKRTDPIIEVSDYKYSGGLGGLASLGAYAKVWRISVNPNFQTIYSGGGNSSFLFWGFNLPVAFYF